MYALDLAKKEAITALKKAIGKSFGITADMLVPPPKAEYGDLSFPCFQLAKGLGRNPAEIATELAAKIGPSKFIHAIKSLGPYVNFVFDDQIFGTAVLEDVLKGRRRYGRSTTGKGKKVLVEYAQPNTHKEFHVGHIRNAVLGQAVVNVMRMNGYETIAASYIGDIGAHVAKALWGLEKFYKDKKIAKTDRAKILGEAYAKAHAHAEEHAEDKGEIARVQQLLETETEPWHALWQETREWSLKEFRAIFKELGVKPDVWYFESQVEKPGKELVKQLLIDGIAKKSEGAVIVDLAEENLGVFLILKSDGSALYSTKDLPLALRKEEDYHPDRQIFIVDTRQSLYLQQLFATLKRMGFQRELVHLGYEFVTLPDGAMSSRKGNIVRYEDLRDTLVEKIARGTKERHADWSTRKLNTNVQAVAIAAMTFIMLRQDTEKKITFDMEEATAVEGFTGPYVLYSIARAETLLKKSGASSVANAESLTHARERGLLRLLALFPTKVQHAGTSFSISSLAAYAFELAQAFAAYYEEVRILDDEDTARKGERLALVEAVKQALSNTCEILGIPVVSEM